MVFTGGSFTIRWRSSDNAAVARHRLSLYQSNGAQPPVFTFLSEIAAEVAGQSQAFIWAVPSTLTSTSRARIRITATDDEGVESEVYSGDDFTIARRWETMAALPIGLQRLGVASDGKYLYAIGGSTSSSAATTVASVHRYDPAGTTWVIFSPPPVPLSMPSGWSSSRAGYLNGHIYVPGGFSSSGTLALSHFAYDVEANSWASVAEVPSGASLYALAADEARGVYYLTGGNNSLGVAVATVRSYDPRTNTWSELPPMNTARSGHEAALIGGKLYVAGGSGASGSLQSAEVYDFETKQWAPIASLTNARRYATSAVGLEAAGNPLWFIFGGEDPATGSALATAEVYDARARRWIALDSSFNLTTARRFLGGAVLGGVFHAVGGATPNVSTTAHERARLDGVTPVSFDQPPVLAVPAAQVAIAGAELRFEVSANDLGSGVPLTITAEGLPAGASFTTSNATNNSARGTFRWTPASSDVGQTFTLTFTASDGHGRDIKTVSVRVAEATTFTAVNAASYLPGAPLAADSIAAGFGVKLAVRELSAATLPLPVELAGTTVTVNGVAAPLFYVGPNQINFALPSSLEPGPATIIARSPDGLFALGTVNIVAAAPFIFTADASGRGDAAAQATVDGVTYQLPPFDVTVGGRPNILVLYATGLRHAPAANPGDGNGVAEAASVTIGGQPAAVLYAGAQGQYAGLDQINVELPQSLAGGLVRRVEVVVSVNGVEANRVTILIK
jgi:uncharacterized protein (TIGR03437 family)